MRHETQYHTENSLFLPEPISSIFKACFACSISTVLVYITLVQGTSVQYSIIVFIRINMLKRKWKDLKRGSFISAL